MLNPISSRSIVPTDGYSNPLPESLKMRISEKLPAFSRDGKIDKPVIALSEGHCLVSQTAKKIGSFFISCLSLQNQKQQLTPPIQTSFYRSYNTVYIEGEKGADSDIESEASSTRPNTLASQSTEEGRPPSPPDSPSSLSTGSSETVIARMGELTNVRRPVRKGLPPPKTPVPSELKKPVPEDFSDVSSETSSSKTTAPNTPDSVSRSSSKEGSSKTFSKPKVFPPLGLESPPPIEPRFIAGKLRECRDLHQKLRSFNVAYARSPFRGHTMQTMHKNHEARELYLEGSKVDNTSKEENYLNTLQDRGKVLKRMIDTLNAAQVTLNNPEKEEEFLHYYTHPGDLEILKKDARSLQQNLILESEHKRNLTDVNLKALQRIDLDLKNNPQLTRWDEAFASFEETTEKDFDTHWQELEQKNMGELKQAEEGLKRIGTAKTVKHSKLNRQIIK